MTGKGFWGRLTAAMAAATVISACTVNLPVNPIPRQSVWLDQGWSREEQLQYHHADQGTQTFGIPYEWFVALEQTSLSSTEMPLLSDKAYLDRFGYIPGASSLPVGFAQSAAFVDELLKPWNNPATGAVLTGVGLTCAACHTGRMTYQGTEMLIDGGSALTDVVALNEALHFALSATYWNAARSARFAARVLGPSASDEAKAALRSQMLVLLLRQDRIAALELLTAPGSPKEGFGRLDALNRIGNQVFGLDIGVTANYHARTAPVHYPHIWTAPWFTWVQYNGSIQQPMVRNAGEAMGVAARVNLTKPGPGLFDSTIPVDRLHWIEQTLAGRQSPFPAKAFSGLRSPAWPAILPPIDRAKAEKGAALYKELCQGCHLPAPNTPEFWNSAWWVQIDKDGDRYLNLKQISVEKIGTDPAQADGMIQRTVQTNRAVPLASTNFGLALGELVEKVVNRWYDTRTPPVPPAIRREMNGNRPNGLRADRDYKARPLNGIWAVPPYLHNGSIPSLYALLSPLAERPSLVHLGDREFDPVHVGYRDNKIAGGFTLDTSIAGNRNTGHVFTSDPGAKGRIGRGLSPEERLSLIEYLKTL